MRQFLDQLPQVIAAKPDPLRRRVDDAGAAQIAARALEATLYHRQACWCTTRARANGPRPTWCIPIASPTRRAACISSPTCPEYSEVRTFAAERIEELSLQEERFTPIEELGDDAFPNSLGVHSGPPERVAIDFQPAVADYVRAA